MSTVHFVVHQSRIHKFTTNHIFGCDQSNRDKGKASICFAYYIFVGKLHMGDCWQLSLEIKHALFNRSMKPYLPLWGRCARTSSSYEHSKRRNRSFESTWFLCFKIIWGKIERRSVYLNFVGVSNVVQLDGRRPCSRVMT